MKCPPLTAESLKAGTQERPQWFGLDPQMGPCWVATRGRFCRHGYARWDWWIGGKQRRLSTHIVAYLLDTMGPMDRVELLHEYVNFRASGLQLDHECHNPSCRRPSHLTPRTQSENIMAGRERDYQRSLARGPVEHFESDEVLAF